MGPSPPLLGSTASGLLASIARTTLLYSADLAGSKSFRLYFT